MTITAAHLELRQAARELGLKAAEIGDDLLAASNLLHAISARLAAAQAADKAAWSDASADEQAAVTEIGSRLLEVALEQAADAVTRVVARMEP